MITVGTACDSGFKNYALATAEDLESLRRKLIESGHRVVHLISVDAMDGDWTYVKSNIPVGNLSEADLAWLNEPLEGRWASQRYLGCSL